MVAARLYFLAASFSVVVVVVVELVAGGVAGGVEVVVVVLVVSVFAASDEGAGVGAGAGAGAGVAGVVVVVVEDVVFEVLLPCWPHAASANASAAEAAMISDLFMSTPWSEGMVVGPYGARLTSRKKV
jgi:hypothetical protein